MTPRETLIDKVGVVVGTLIVFGLLIGRYAL